MRSSKTSRVGRAICQPTHTFSEDFRAEKAPEPRSPSPLLRPTPKPQDESRPSPSVLLYTCLFRCCPLLKLLIVRRSRLLSSVSAPATSARSHERLLPSRMTRLRLTS